MGREAPPDAPRVIDDLDADSRDWLHRLKSPGPTGADAVDALFDLLHRAALHECGRRRGALPATVVAELDDLARQAADDAVAAVLRKLPEYRGGSRFTTWAYKFVILEVSAKVGRHFWRRPGVRMDAEDWDRLPASFGFDPAQEAEWRDLLAALRRAVDEELTARQRRVFVALVLTGVPLDALVIELASSRNAIYKTLFDARRKLRAALAANGYIGDG